MKTLHLMTQDNQPYGSERKCCEECGYKPCSAVAGEVVSDIAKCKVDGYLPGLNGKPVLASCGNCAHISDESDGPEYGPSWYICKKTGKEHMSNLKGFPFKTAQKCCELHFVHLTDWDEEAGKAEMLA